MIKNLFYNYCQKIKLQHSTVINRSISCSATRNQDSESDNVDSRLFPDILRTQAHSNDVNVKRLTNLLDGNHVKLKSSLRKFLCSDMMKPRYDISIQQEQNLSHQRLKQLCNSGFMSASICLEDPKRIFATYELAAVVDPAMAFKMNAQFNWFTGTLIKLGCYENCADILPDIDNLNVVGCFGLTELGSGHGGIETTAVYDHDTKEITIDTPNPFAQKYWVTNGAVHAKYMIVFANLFVEGKNVGVHSMLVKIRDEQLNIMPDVHIEDMGHKMGLNGVDAAKVSFDSVRIPKENLLTKYCNITEEGKYICAFKNEKKKFLVMRNELLTGKISVAAMCNGAAKASLAIAIRYAATRMVPGPTKQAEIPLLHYKSHQRALMPLLARTYTLQFGLNYLQNRYCHQPEDGSHHDDIVTLTSAIKALLSWNLENVVNVCREKCGGQGFLSCNRFGTFLNLAHAAISAEGDNGVLMENVVKQRILVFENRKVTSPPRDFFSIVFLIELLNKKENLHFVELTEKVYKYGQEKAFELWVLDEAELVQICGKAFIERAISDELVTIADKCDRNERILLKAIHRLYILHIFERDLGQMLSLGIIASHEVVDMKYELEKLIRNFSLVAMELVDAFNFPDEMLSAPIAGDWVKYNSGDNKGEVS